MGTKNHNGQVVIELLISALIIATIFFFLAELGNISIHEQKKTRFAQSRGAQ
jgi:hypothetical protein